LATEVTQTLNVLAFLILQPRKKQDNKLCVKTLERRRMGMRGRGSGDEAPGFGGEWGHGDGAQVLGEWGHGDGGIGGGGLSSTAGFGAGDGRAPAGDRGDGAPVGGVLLQRSAVGWCARRRPARGRNFFFFLSRVTWCR